MKDPLKSLQARATAARSTQAYHAEGVSLRFTEDLLARMEAQGITRAALAERIGSTPAYVTKILRGDTNFTLDTMVKIARALDCELAIGLSPAKPKLERKPTEKAIPKARPLVARSAKRP